MIRKITVPVDYTDDSDNAALFAVKLAAETGAIVHFIHVFGIPVQTTDMPTFIIPVTDIEQEEKRRIENWSSKQAFAGITCAANAVAGYPDDEIVNQADIDESDLIILAAGKNVESFFGSTTTAVIRKSKVPVLIVPAEASFKSFERVAIAYDNKDQESVNSLTILKNMHSIWKFSCALLHVKKDDALPDGEEAVKVIKLDHALEGINHDFFFIDDENVEEGIFDFCEQKDMDLLVLLPHRHSFFQRLFRSGLTKKMVAHTLMPLLCIPEN